MGHLKLFRPELPAADDISREQIDEPIVLSFETRCRLLNNRFSRDVVTRAHTIFRNQCCPTCRRRVVEPIELADALFNRNNLPIPGTATLVGFHCCACEREWPA
jgi:hypothetical protein